MDFDILQGAELIVVTHFCVAVDDCLHFVQTFLEKLQDFGVHFLVLFFKHDRGVKFRQAVLGPRFLELH